jgi:hypothetical protein
VKPAVVIHLTRYAPALIVGAMSLAFARAAAKIPDPALQRGTFAAEDRRAHRYGSLTYAQASALIAQLREERDGAADPAETALLSVRLSDVFVVRQLFDEAWSEIDEALRLAPNESAVLVRAALVRHALGDDAGARDLLHRGEIASPADPEVARARAFLGGVSPRTAASSDRSE